MTSDDLLIGYMDALKVIGPKSVEIRVPVSAEPCPCRGVVGTAG